MGDDSLILREDGYIRMNFPVTSLTYHSNLNIILVKTDVGAVHALDVNSGVILQSSFLSADDAGAVGVEYAEGADRVFVWDSSGVGARADYNGVLLLHTALQRPLPSSQPDKIIRIELILSEAVLLYQCLQSLDAHSIEGLTDFVNELKNSIDAEPLRKGVKAQKWSAVTISLPQSVIRLVATGVVQDLKGQNRRIPALAIASAVGQRASELVPYHREEESRTFMYSEAERKETFKRWPHMDYKWALPARMAQAGFYHQPSPSGDDRAMCFTCMVCLVCWEKSDEPWVEHERHSPNCPFVRGEYTHNVPISVSNATSSAVPSPNVSIVSKGNAGDVIASGTTEGNVNIWKFSCRLKLIKFIHLSPYDSIFSGILPTDTNKVWSASLEKDSSTYGLELTAMSFIGMTSQQETYPQTHNNDHTDKDQSTNKSKPSLICAVTITRTPSSADQPIKEEDSSKALFDSGDKDKESVQAMNDQNEAKSNLTTSNKMLFLLTYDIHSSLAGSTTTVVHTSNSSGNSKPGGSKKVCTVARTDDANIYDVNIDDIYFQYSDEDTELPQCTSTLIDEQISNVINLNASSSKEDAKIWTNPKKILMSKHFKVLPPPLPTAILQELPESGQGSMLDFVGKISQLKSWKSGNLDSVGTKLADQTDAVLQGTDSITHYLNMNGPLEISDLKWYDGGDGTEKVKVTTFGGSKVGTQTAVGNGNNDGFDSDPPQEDVISQGIAVQCLSLPAKLNLRDDSRVTHLIPTEDKEYLLVIVSSIDPNKVKNEEEVDSDGDAKMDVDDASEHSDKFENPDTKAYFILYKINKKTSIFTLEDNPTSFKELPYGESPVDLCLLPIDKKEEYSLAAVGIDGAMRLYALPDFGLLSEKRVPKGQFTSVVYCAAVERLSVSTKHGMIYFYALNNGEKEAGGDVDEDELSPLDVDMYILAGGFPPEPVVTPIANKAELEMEDLQALNALTMSQGSNTTVPYSAVVPGFWCELSPAQRSKQDHHNNRTWRLQNTSSTWDEHVLELTLPYSMSLAHIEFGFTLHTPSTNTQFSLLNLPIIQVTLLKQNLHGLGYKKDASFGQRSDSPVQFPVIDSDMSSNVENPVSSEEYLQAHNAEILAGPLLLSSGLDLTQQSGTLILTSPRLYRAQGKTFLIHIKTLYDPAKDMNKASKSTESTSKKSGFIGCDWLHQISLTVRSSAHTTIPRERQQRIAMLESNSFLNNLCEIAISRGDVAKRSLALDLLIWVVSIRLQRLRLAKTEKGKDKESWNPVEAQQLECVKTIEKHFDALIKNCILCANRSIAKKCVKIILITSEGVKQLPKPWKCTFDQTLFEGINSCIPYLGACESPGALRWLVALGQQISQKEDASEQTRCLISRCLELLEKTAKCLTERGDEYHQLLRARFGLYGLPLERCIFGSEVPDLGRGSAPPVTYASYLAGDSATPPVAKQEYQLKDLLNLPPEGDTELPATKPDYQKLRLRDLLNMPIEEESKTVPSPLAWWAQNNSVAAFGAGLGEAMPLHVSCHVASDGTKLESSGARHPQAVVSSLPTDTHQLWTVVKEGQSKQVSKDPDSLEDVESTLMDCDPQEKPEFSEDSSFKDQEECMIPWSQLVQRPPQHTLVVERMHSGARRYIVLDFGHTVRLSDIIIPSCSDLVTLCIDIWTKGEETDCSKLAFATDIATKHLVLTDIQPPPLCRYMKITTIGRYGMSAMKCKIPLGWFYGEIADVSNVQASINALGALYQDLTCKFRLATGKLMDLLNPYLDLYNANAAHMMAYLNIANESDPKVITAYQECIELQQQLHTCKNVIKKLQNKPECNNQVLDMISKGKISSEFLLERASTDKLRVISESLVEMLLYFYFINNVTVEEQISRTWCENVMPLVWQFGGRSAASLATLLPRLCGHQAWWGQLLATSLIDAFEYTSERAVSPADRVLVLVIYMCRKSVLSHTQSPGGVVVALCTRALQLLQQAAHSTLPAVLAALAAVLDPVQHTHSRWDWVTGGRAGSGPVETVSPSTRSSDTKLHRRKLHKKLLHKMQELEAARRGIQQALEEQQRARFELKARMAMVKAGGGAAGGAGAGAEGGAEGSVRWRAAARLVPAALAWQLARALVELLLLRADNHTHADTIMLAAKVVGRLVCLSGSGSLDAASILGLARMAVTLQPWPRHAITTLLQDVVEMEGGFAPRSPSDESRSWSKGPRASRPNPVSLSDSIVESDDSETELDQMILTAMKETKIKIPSPSSIGRVWGKAPKYNRANTVADVLADSFGLNKDSNNADTNTKATSPGSVALNSIVESDDSETELDQMILKVMKETRIKISSVESCSSMSACMEGGGGGGGAGGGGGCGAAGEALCRRALAAGAGALAAGVRAAPPPRARLARSDSTPRHHHHHHTLPDVFTQLAADIPNQSECSYLENMISLWLTLNGSNWGNGSGWTHSTICVPCDSPRIRLTADTVDKILTALNTLEHVTLRCWVLTMQALAWIASLSIQSEGSNQTMGRIILENENFVPAIVKFVTINVATDGAVSSSEPYLGAAGGGATGGAACALQSVLSRVAGGRGAAGAAVCLRIVCQVWDRADPPPQHDLQATLLRVATPMLQVLSVTHVPYALNLIETVSRVSGGWVRAGGAWGARAEAALSALLGDVLAGAASQRRPTVRRAHLLHYATRLLAIHPHQPSESREEPQTDEIKAAHSSSQQQDSTNVEDERKQQAVRTPCIADLVLQNHSIMHKFYKTLMLCDGMNMEQSAEYSSLKEEVFWMVAHMITVASNPALMVPSIIVFLRKEEVINLSQGMQQLMIRLLDKPEALSAFIESEGLELAVEKLNACHKAGPSNNQGLVSFLMNHLKLPVQLINMSTSAANSTKKNQPPVIETANGLINIAPLCSVSCSNPTAQAAEVLLGGGGAAACAARRVRAPAWSYPFFSADDACLALTLQLPHAAMLHELQLQPHLASLATCPGAVGIEAGCGGTLSPVGAPICTAGMTSIRLVVSRPVICTTVLVRLYKPRDSSNMGLLNLRLLVAPPFTSQQHHTNAWSGIVMACVRGAGAGAGAGAGVAALCACVAAGGAGAGAARLALLHAARADPHQANHVLRALLDQHVSPFQVSGSSSGETCVCSLLRQLCMRCGAQCVAAFTQWLQRREPAASRIHTLAAVLWTLKEESTLENLEEYVTNELFALVKDWVKDVPDTSLLKTALDAVLCSMCYIRPELFRLLLEDINMPINEDESMEGLTDDSKVQTTRSPRGRPVWELSAGQRATLGAAALSPAAAAALHHSRLPEHAVARLAEFCENKLQMIQEQMGSQDDLSFSDLENQFTSQSKELKSMSVMCSVVEWLRQLVVEPRFKDWLGAEGSIFWKPLLNLLCYNRPPDSSWQETAQYAKLEESTIRLFADLTVCHPHNQKLFATTLYEIIEAMDNTGECGLSGFTRALLLRLVLSAERVCVCVRWGGAASPAPPSAPAPHPSMHSHLLLQLPVHTTVQHIRANYRPPVPLLEEGRSGSAPSPGGSGSTATAGGSVLRSASDTAIMTVAEAWELSLAAASASKDKRVKDVKNTSLKQQQNTKKRQGKVTADASVMSLTDDLLESSYRVTAAGIEGQVGGGVTLAQLCAAAPHPTIPHVTLTLHFNTGESSSSGTWKGGSESAEGAVTRSVLREFGAVGGLGAVAARLPRPAPPQPPHAPEHKLHHHDPDWVKLDDHYEEVVETGPAAEEGAWGGVPAHALAALGLLLKLPGYAAALLEQGPRAVTLLRLLLGQPPGDDAVGGCGSGNMSGLGTLPFVVVWRLLEAGGAGAEGAALRAALLARGGLRLVLACLALLTHHENGQSGSGSKCEDASQLYWAKGTGFGTGSTQQSWNVEQALVRQRTEEQHVTQLLLVLASYMNPGEKWPPEEGQTEGETEGESETEKVELPDEFIELVANSSLVPAIASYLRNDSVLDMSRHIPLYVSVLRCARALHSLRRPRLHALLQPLPKLLAMMSRTTNCYATKLRMSKKNVFGKMTYSQRFSTSSNSELSEEDEGLASLIADIQATAALVSPALEREEEAGAALARASGATREARYLHLMRTMQFETFEMISEDGENGFRFTVPYHFEVTVRAAGSRAHPARMKRLAQEAATLATSLPLSYSSSVFVRTDTDRLDVMKVLITGPSDTPYANGCFILDVYFPGEYPLVPMLINLETTGRHSVRFNPNLYSDGKVCLSVLNTWHGRPEEKWTPHTSSFLQVLVSIQSLILVPEPYFNEPGYERSRGTRAGSAASLEYNSNIYQASARWAMLDQLRDPEPAFKEVIQTHFWIKRNEIMTTVAGWIQELESYVSEERTQRPIQLNLVALKRHYVKLGEELAKLPCPAGLEDLDEPFQLPAAPVPVPPPEGPPPAPPAAPPAAPPVAPPPAPPDELDHDMEKMVSAVLE